MIALASYHDGLQIENQLVFGYIPDDQPSRGTPAITTRPARSVTSCATRPEKTRPGAALRESIIWFVRTWTIVPARIILSAGYARTAEASATAPIRIEQDVRLIFTAVSSQLAVMNPLEPWTRNLFGVSAVGLSRHRHALVDLRFGQPLFTARPL